MGTDRCNLNIGPSQTAAHIKQSRGGEEPAGTQRHAAVPIRGDPEDVLVRSYERKARRAKKKITRISAAVKNCGLFSPAEVRLCSNHVVRRDLIVPAAISASTQGDV